ncbi:MAG: YebC/PmpR family DNA-binding transcriptional regulator [Gammaproteobacteria bacterium]|nr:YebC/PmpR family DNA-binding transcriptional regulator [Gammaproteobacteria bacterium]
MAGHSKWANIRFRKAAQDAKRGKLFTKLIREITVSARTSGGDPDANPRLRTAIDKALGANMGRDTVERAIKRGTGELEGVSYDEVRYEGYASGGAAVLVECATDNRNRTVSEVRHVFSKHGGNLGTDGSVAYLFNKVGTLVFPSGSDEEKIMEAAIEAGAEDVNTDDDGSIEVMTTPESFESVKSKLVANGLKPEIAEVAQRPATEAPVEGEEAEKVLCLLDALEELDDVQDVFTNASFPPELAQAS